MREGAIHLFRGKRMHKAYRAAAASDDQETGEKDGRTCIEKPAWHPHDQTGELLILQRREIPGDAGGGCCHVQETWRHNHERSEQSGMHGGQKEISDGRRIRGSAAVSLEQSPPEHQGRAEKARMLQPVDSLISEGS